MCLRHRVKPKVQYRALVTWLRYHAAPSVRRQVWVEPGELLAEDVRLSVGEDEQETNYPGMFHEFAKVSAGKSQCLGAAIKVTRGRPYEGCELRMALELHDNLEPTKWRVIQRRSLEIKCEPIFSPAAEVDCILVRSNEHELLLSHTASVRPTGAPPQRRECAYRCAPPRRAAPSSSSGPSCCQPSLV